MISLINHIRSSKRLQGGLVWLTVLFLLIVQSLWVGALFSIVLSVTSVVQMFIINRVTYTFFAPNLLLKKRVTLTVVISVAFIFLLAYLSMFLETNMLDRLNLLVQKPPVHVFLLSRHLLFYTLTYVVTIIIFFQQKTMEEKRNREELLSQKKQLEELVLKSQINSHFLFNALNNIYSMVYFKDETSAEYIMKLSQMMRYVMEECEAQYVPMSKDVVYMQNYIDFQKLRFEGAKDVMFNYDIAEENTMIPPMIFQPFIENCFKYAPLDTDKNAFIHIGLSVKDHTVVFDTINTQPLIKQHRKGGGIGLENVKKRLQIYFPNNYSLDVIDLPGNYCIKLTINLK